MDQADRGQHLVGLFNLFFDRTLLSFRESGIIVVQGASPQLTTFSGGKNNETKYYCYQVRGDTIK